MEPWDFLKCRDMEKEDPAKETERAKPLIEEENQVSAISSEPEETVQRKSAVSHAKFLYWKLYHLNVLVSLSVSVTGLNSLSAGFMSYFRVTRV